MKRAKGRLEGSFKSAMGSHLCILTFRISSVSPRGQREGAIVLLQFERIIRYYPRAEGLTSNERSITLALFKSTSP
jgi:hypothetical protein